LANAGAKIGTIFIFAKTLAFSIKPVFL